jgi:ATP-dependent RNA helicase DDX10/DBP4
MDETPMFDCVSLKVLVLDEADRILDLGFRETLAAILENLPKKGRQTLLFSATQTKSVKDLARLSMRDPEYLACSLRRALTRRRRSFNRWWRRVT